MASAKAAVDDVAGMVGRAWGWLFALGLISVILGIVALVWTKETLEVIGWVFLIYLIVFGIVRIFQALFIGGPGGARVLVGLTGVIMLILAWLVFNFAGHLQDATGVGKLEGDAIGSVLLLGIFIGVAWLIGGVTQLFLAIENKGDPGRGWAIFLGIISIIAGLILIFIPAEIVVLVWVGGIFLIIIGIVEMFNAFRLRKLVG
jgi:uncharacterized membrane protein HdeD (DUF308 family)